MKLKLTVEQVREPILIEALRELRDLKLHGDQLALFNSASNKILDEHVRYHKLRDDWLRKNGDEVGDDQYRVVAGDPRREQLLAYEADLAKEAFEIRLVDHINLPAGFAISANHYAALTEAGIVKEITTKEETHG